MCMYPTQNTFFKFIFSPVSSFPLGTQQMSLLCTQKGVKVFSREELRKKAAGRSRAEIPSISLKQTKLKQTKGKLSKESVEVTGMLGEALNFMPAKKKKKLHEFYQHFIYCCAQQHDRLLWKKQQWAANICCPWDATHTTMHNGPACSFCCVFTVKKPTGVSCQQTHGCNFAEVPVGVFGSRAAPWGSLPIHRYCCQCEASQPSSLNLYPFV